MRNNFSFTISMQCQDTNSKHILIVFKKLIHNIKLKNNRLNNTDLYIKITNVYIKICEYI